MPPLTWRNVDAPNFSDSNDMFKTAAGLLNTGFDAANSGIDKFVTTTTKEQSAKLMQDIIAAGGDEAAIQAAIAGGNSAFLSPEALNFGNAQPDVLLNRQGLRLDNEGQIATNQGQAQINDQRAIDNTNANNEYNSRGANLAEYADINARAGSDQAEVRAKAEQDRIAALARPGFAASVGITDYTDANAAQTVGLATETTQAGFNQGLEDKAKAETANSYVNGILNQTGSNYADSQRAIQGLTDVDADTKALMSARLEAIKDTLPPVDPSAAVLAAISGERPEQTVYPTKIGDYGVTGPRVTNVPSSAAPVVPGQVPAAATDQIIPATATTLAQLPPIPPSALPAGSPGAQLLTSAAPTQPQAAAAAYAPVAAPAGFTRPAAPILNPAAQLQAAAAPPVAAQPAGGTVDAPGYTGPDAFVDPSFPATAAPVVAAPVTPAATQPGPTNAAAVAANPAVAAAPPPSATGGPPVAPGSTAEYLRNGMIARGLPAHVADAFLMNFQDESGLNSGINEQNPTVAGSRGGYGLYQLTGPRRKAYENYADSIGVDYSNPDAQLDFMMQELNSTEKGAYNRMLATSDAGTAAAVIVDDFLRPAQVHRDSRRARYLAGSSGEYSQGGFEGSPSGSPRAEPGLGPRRGPGYADPSAIPAKGADYSIPVDPGRPQLTNPNGSVSTEKTTTVQIDGKWTNLPTIFDGKRHTEAEAIEAYRAGNNPATGQFDRLEDAEADAQRRSNQAGEMIDAVANGSAERAQAGTRQAAAILEQTAAPAYARSGPTKARAAEMLAEEARKRPPVAPFNMVPEQAQAALAATAAPPVNPRVAEIQTMMAENDSGKIPMHPIEVAALREELAAIQATPAVAAQVAAGGRPRVARGPVNVTPGDIAALGSTSAPAAQAAAATVPAGTTSIIPPNPDAQPAGVPAVDPVTGEAAPTNEELAAAADDGVKPSTVGGIRAAFALTKDMNAFNGTQDVTRQLDEAIVGISSTKKDREVLNELIAPGAPLEDIPKIDAQQALQDIMAKYPNINVATAGALLGANGVVKYDEGFWTMGGTKGWKVDMGEVDRLWGLYNTSKGGDTPALMRLSRREREQTVLAEVAKLETEYDTSVAAYEAWKASPQYTAAMDIQLTAAMEKRSKGVITELDRIWSGREINGNLKLTPDENDEE